MYGVVFQVWIVIACLYMHRLPTYLYSRVVFISSPLELFFGLELFIIYTVFTTRAHTLYTLVSTFMPSLIIVVMAVGRASIGSDSPVSASFRAGRSPWS